MTDACFHCALPIPADCRLSIEVGGKSRAVCCPGCKAVANLILTSGMENYYEQRDTPRPGGVRPDEEASEWRVFDTPDMLRAFTEGDDRECSTNIYVEGMYCSACAWLIESTFARLTGIRSADVSPITHRLRVHYDPEKTGLSKILTTLAELGYRPQPLAPESKARPELLEQRAALKRLLVASLGMMQVMMFAVGLYAGDYQGIDADMQRFLRFVSFFVTTPVVFYSARPFFAGAARGLRARRPGMDLPVSIAIGAAYAASVYATFTNGPAVWFDSVTMFVFFLTVGRFLEMRARHRSIDRGSALSATLPNTATRIEGGAHSVVPIAQLAAGDVILLRPGDAVPADGVVNKGRSMIDEAVLTGESAPQERTQGDVLVAGSVNLDNVIEMRVNRTGSDTTLSAISRLSERARYARPAFVQLADRVASWVVIAILLIAVVVAITWSIVDPSRAFVITLSVLVVTCPCALALATPAAFAATGSRLTDLQLLLCNGNAIDSLARVTHVLFDKTGTLTRGRPALMRIELLSPDLDEQEIVRIAASLEAVSTHPLADAFCSDQALLHVDDRHVHTGSGVSGIIDGREWRIGKPGFVDSQLDQDSQNGQPTTTVWLGNNDHVVAKFAIDDDLRSDALQTLRALENMGLSVAVASGDTAEVVERVADRIGIGETHSDCTPDAKLKIIRAGQSAGKTVLMVGDGINDAPVLAGANASIAPANAALLAQTHADLIMLGDSLYPVVTAVDMSRRTMRIVRQNLVWAIVYNAAALPLAAAGLVSPWLAAIGMSASSLIVVLNSLRLSRAGTSRP